jgi:hypothetical protein
LNRHRAIGDMHFDIRRVGPAHGLHKPTALSSEA